MSKKLEAGIKCSVIPDHASVKYLVRAPSVDPQMWVM